MELKSHLNNYSPTTALVPEPGAATLLGVGLTLLASTRLRRSADRPS